MAIVIFTIAIKKNKRFREMFTSKIKEQMQSDPRLKRILSHKKELYLKYENSVIKKLAMHLETVIKQPEDIIIMHFEDTTDLYILSKGEVSV